MATAATDARARRLAWLGLAATVGLMATGVVLELAQGPTQVPEEGGGTGSTVTFSLLILVFPVVGMLILARQPRNRIGWILMATGLAWAANALGAFATFAMSRGVPGGAVAGGLAAGLWAPPFALMGSVLLLRFPTGELASPRWRWVERWALFSVAMVVVLIALFPSTFEFYGFPDVENPLGVDALEPVLNAAFPVVLLSIPLSILASAVSLVLRFRRSRGTERLQLKWLTTAAAFVAVLYLVGMLASVGNLFGGGEQAGWQDFLDAVSPLGFSLIPISIGIAVLRHRLYEIDVVISKAIVYGSLAMFVTIAYVGIVVGIGQAIGTDRSVPLQVAATVVVAVAFQPLHERVQRFANRLVYGKRATPYEVLASFAEQVAGSYATDEIASAVARLLVEGTGATASEIWVRTEGEPRLEAVWPVEHVAGRSLPADDDLTRVVPVLHRREVLGDVVIRKAANDPIGPADEKLLADVAGQAGLVLRNVRLIEDLRASRQRLVAARDDERRKLERNIHDGAQQRLVALAVLYNMAANLAHPLGEDQRAALADLGVQAQSALETLRDLARGIYPAVLSDGGLVPALESQARKSAVPVEIVPDGIRRYGQEVEAAVYFCCLEALQNVAKYAGASRALLRLEDADGEVRFEVEDDGVGFDPATIGTGSGMANMEDRLAAIGGSLDVRSSPGAGTIVRGRVPTGRRVRVPEPVG